MLKVFKQLLKKSKFARYVTRRYRLRARLPKCASIIGENQSYWNNIAKNVKDGKNILFATSCGGNLPATNLETLLAVALTMRNASVSVLLCDGVLPACFLCDIEWYREEKHFAKHGPAKSHCKDCFSLIGKTYSDLGIPVLRYSELIEKKDLDIIEEISSNLSLPEINNYIHNGIPIGEHALAGAVRFYAKASLNDPYAEIVLRRYFRAALITSFVMQNLFVRQKFECVVFDFGMYVPHGVTGEVARREGVRVVNWHVAYRKKCFIFSHHETYHHTLMSEPVKNWEDMRWNKEMEEEIVAYLKSRWHGTNDWIIFNEKPQNEVLVIEKEVGVDFSKSCIGMLTNVMWDAQLHYPGNTFKNMLDWVITTIDYFTRRPDLQLLIRVHPAEFTGTLRSRQPIIGEIRKKFPTLPKNIFIIPPESKISTYTAMLKCNTIIIYGTKTGVELTSMGIPTIAAGEAWIRNKGVTMDVNSIKEYFTLLDRLPLSKPLSKEITQRALKYAYHYFFRRMIPLKCAIPTQYFPPFKISISSIRELEQGCDIGLDVICNGILNGSEFIYPAELV